MTETTAPRPDVAVVLGPWSSGTSAVAAVVAALGANGHPPFLRLTDPLTPISGESRELRRILSPCFSHDILQRTGTPDRLVPRLRIWAGPGLSVAKMAMLTWFLPEVLTAWTPHFIVVHRPLDLIEATRERRGWPPVYGRKGAEHIEAMIAREIPEDARRIDVEYEALREDPVTVGAGIAAFLDLPMNAERVRDAVRQG